LRQTLSAPWAGTKLSVMILGRARQQVPESQPTLTASPQSKSSLQPQHKPRFSPEQGV
jgi:hypothetical protein